MQTTDIADYIQQFSYLGIFIWFLVIEQLTPIPEEVSLISLGYLCMHNHLDLFIAGGFSLAGLLITDNGLFYLSAKGRLLTDKLTRNYNGKVMSKLKKGAACPHNAYTGPMRIASENQVCKSHYCCNFRCRLEEILYGQQPHHMRLRRCLCRQRSIIPSGPEQRAF